MLSKIYHKSPKPLKTIFEKGYYSIPFPYLYGSKFINDYKWLMKSQWLTHEELDEIQNERLRLIIDHAYENVPYYRECFSKLNIKPKDIKTKEDLKLLPYLSKDALKTQYEELLATNYTKFRSTPSHTSGSTGIPLKYHLDKNNRTWEIAFISRHWEWMGYNPNMRQVVLRGGVSDTEEFYLIQGNNLILSSFLLNQKSLDKYVEKILKFKPTLIRGYPSVLYTFAKLLKENNIQSVRPKAIQTSSETLLPHMRREIEDVLNCKVYDLYGNGEHVSLVTECPEDGYHINLEYGIIELINKNGEDAKPGELAEMVCTGLNNFSMPLIRYKIGDYAISSNKKCPCGRELPLVESVEGRVDDMIITPDGRSITPAGMTLAFEFIDNIKQCQLVQPNKEELIINIIKNTKYEDKDHKFMLNEVRQRVGDELKITVNFVDELQKTKAGKFRFVISHIN